MIAYGQPVILVYEPFIRNITRCLSKSLFFCVNYIQHVNNNNWKHSSEFVPLDFDICFLCSLRELGH